MCDYMDGALPLSTDGGFSDSLLCSPPPAPGFHSPTFMQPNGTGPYAQQVDKQNFYYVTNPDLFDLRLSVSTAAVGGQQLTINGDGCGVPVRNVNVNCAPPSVDMDNHFQQHKGRCDAAALLHTASGMNRNAVPYSGVHAHRTIWHQHDSMPPPSQPLAPNVCSSFGSNCDGTSDFRTGLFYRNRMQGAPPQAPAPTQAPPPPPQYFGLDCKIYEMNKRLQHRSEDPSNAALWWDAFVSEFFEDDATLTLTFNLDKGSQRYTVGRLLIPRYFRTIFEGGAVQLYYLLNMPMREFFEQGRGVLVLDCENAIMIAHYNKAMSNVHTEGRLICEFSAFPTAMGDELVSGRIRNWHFFIRHNTEFIPRSILSANNMDQGTMEQLSRNVTVQGFMKSTLSFLGVCVILEPMQELMSRSRTYPNMTPRECLTTTAFQKWQEMNAIANARQQRAAAAAAATGGTMTPPAHSMLPPAEEVPKPTKGKRKRKGSSNTGGTPSTGGGKKKNAVSPAPAAPNFPITSHVDVMVVSEPSLMGGEFVDEDERMISRLENTQFDQSSMAMGLPGPSMHYGGPMGPMSTAGGLMGLQAMTQDPSIFDWPAPPPHSHGPPSLPHQHSIAGGGPPSMLAGSISNPNTPLGRTATPANTSNGSGGPHGQGVRTPSGGSSSPAQPMRPLSTNQNGSRQGTPNAMPGGPTGNMTPTSYV